MVNFYTYLEIFLPDLSRQVGLNEFEKYFGKPHQTLKNRLNPFVKNNVLNQEKRGKFLFYRLNLKNPLTWEFLSLCEKERLINFLDENTLFQRLYKKLSYFFDDSEFMIFGSSVFNEDFSDIDLLAFTDNGKIKKTVEEFAQTYSTKIHFLKAKKKDLSDAFVQELRDKHLIINSHDSFLEVLYK
ncbi:MAG: hypothetical protein ACQEP1_05165 [Nanobdellota archaeon]